MWELADICIDFAGCGPALSTLVHKCIVCILHVSYIYGVLWCCNVGGGTPSSVAFDLAFGRCLLQALCSVEALLLSLRISDIITPFRWHRLLCCVGLRCCCSS